MLTLVYFCRWIHCRVDQCSELLSYKSSLAESASVHLIHRCTCTCLMSKLCRPVMPGNRCFPNFHTKYPLMSNFCHCKFRGVLSLEYPNHMQPRLNSSNMFFGLLNRDTFYIWVHAFLCCRHCSTVFPRLLSFLTLNLHFRKPTSFQY